MLISAIEALLVGCFFFCFADAVPSPAANSNTSPSSNSSGKYVTAHFMVGIVPNYVVADWKQDMANAQEIGIDAFALNCAPTRVDYYTPKQLANAYEAASQMNFRVFISFDFAYWNSGDTAEIINFMNKYATHPAQLMYNGGALVSTFVGDSFDWGPVKAGTRSKLFAMPNQSDPRGSSYLNTQFDGVFSWYAWPTSGNNAPTPARMTTFWDDIFITNLAGRPYMAPVSPWFSPHFANKNWVFICEQLITDRWKQILVMKPDILQVVSWNDYGEGHYIAPWQPNHSDDGSSQWTLGFPHDGWRYVMKPYIAAYKSGASMPSVTKDQLVYWYRPTPKNTVCTNDPVGPSDGYQYLADDIFVTTMLTSPATLILVSGTNPAIAVNVPAGIVTSNFPMGVGGQMFYLKRNGVTIMSGIGGRVVTDTCKFYNFNAYVGSINSGDSIGPAPSASISDSSSSTSSSSTSTRMSTSASTTRSGTSSTSVSSSVVTKTTMTSTRTTTTTRSTSKTTSAGSVTTKTTSRTTSLGGTTTTRKSSSTVNSSTTTKPTSTTRRISSTSSIIPRTTGVAESSLVCYAGTGSGNYIGLCQFTCSYGYCPPGPCTCTSYVTSTAARKPPSDNGRKGYPLPYLDASYLGLCAFTCARNYCPSTACYYG